MMTLEKDLGCLVNNPKYSDIEILCEDKKILYGCRAILAARSQVFNGLLYNGMKESYEKQISFPNINSSIMEIVLEYVYTGSVYKKSLSKYNVIETYYTADYFQLPELQSIIINITRNNSEIKNYSSELLSKVVEIMPLTKDNDLIDLLVGIIASTPLDTIEFGRLSIAAFKYFLSYTHENEKPFATSEYEIFRYGAILAAKQVSNDMYKILMEQLPISELENSTIKVNNKFINYQQKIAEELEPLIEFIDFERIKGQILVDVIEPLEIVPSEVILNIYRHNTKVIDSYISVNSIRGIPSYACVWDGSACGSKLIIEDNGKIVRGRRNFPLFETSSSVRVEIILDEGIFEWDVFIEKSCKHVWIGVCALEDFDYESWSGKQSTGWVLGSSGNCFNDDDKFSYCPPFRKDGTKVTVHLDMDERSCTFTVNDKKYPKAWDNLPSRVYPVVSLKHPGCLRVERILRK